MLKILIADDEPKFREYLKKAINWEEYGFVICAEARNGVEALDLAHKHQPHVALLDINMPLMNGLTLAENIKEQLKNICIIFITGYNEFEYARKAIKLGADDYVLKPFKKEELISTLLKLKVRIQMVLEEEERAKGDASFLRERFLNMLIDNEYDAQEVETKRILDRLGISVFSDLFTVISV